MASFKKSFAGVALFLACSQAAGTTGDGTTSQASAVRDAARVLYDARDKNEDLRPWVSSFFDRFDFHVSAATDRASLEAELASGYPIILSPQLQQMSDAMNEGVLVSLDSFIAAMNAKGATVKATGAPLTVEFFTQRMAPLLAKADLGADETLLAMVAALGQERATRDKTKAPDPVWGDRRLDALQFTLLLHTVLHTSSYRKAQGAVPQARARANVSLLEDTSLGVKAFDKFSGHVEGLYEAELQIPITVETARRVSVCASLVLYGYQSTVKVAPQPIWHRQVDGDKPSLAVLTATLAFKEDYFNNFYGWRKDLLEAIGCELPHEGPIEDGVKLEWSLQEPLQEHGAYDLAATTTKDGQALATYRAIVETTPAAKRVFKNQRDATGRVSVQASGLLPGMENLEWIVTSLKETGTNGKSNLTVNYYVDPCKDPGTAPGGDASCDLTWSGTSSVMTTNAGTYSASVSFAFVEALDGISKFAPTGTVTASIPNCTIAPASHAIVPEDGELNVDYTTTPPTYSGAGRTQWTATVTCNGSSGPATIGEPWFMVNLDMMTQAGVPLTDPMTMRGSQSAGGLLNSTWNLTAQAQ